MGKEAYACVFAWIGTVWKYVTLLYQSGGSQGHQHSTLVFNTHLIFLPLFLLSFSVSVQTFLLHMFPFGSRKRFNKSLYEDYDNKAFLNVRFPVLLSFNPSLLFPVILIFLLWTLSWIYLHTSCITLSTLTSLCLCIFPYMLLPRPLSDPLPFPLLLLYYFILCFPPLSDNTTSRISSCLPWLYSAESSITKDQQLD